MSMSMPNEHASMDMPGKHGESPISPKAPDEHHALWAKCGYCDLLFSCPALPGSVSYVTLNTPPPANAPHPRYAPGSCPAEHLPRRPQPCAAHRLVNPKHRYFTRPTFRQTAAGCWPCCLRLIDGICHVQVFC